MACALSRATLLPPKLRLNRPNPIGGTGGGRNSGGPKAHGHAPPVARLICESGMPAHHGHGEPVGPPMPRPRPRPEPEPPHQWRWRPSRPSLSDDEPEELSEDE